MSEIEVTDAMLDAAAEHNRTNYYTGPSSTERERAYYAGLFRAMEAERRKGAPAPGMVEQLRRIEWKLERLLSG